MFLEAEKLSTKTRVHYQRHSKTEIDFQGTIMKPSFFTLLCGACNKWFVFFAVFLSTGCIGTNQASAQWNSRNAISVWAAINNHFLHNNADGYSQSWVETDAGKTRNTFWQQAEMIDMAVDASVWAKTNDRRNLVNYKRHVQALCDGFLNYTPSPARKSGDDWSSDRFNDDIDVAIIAFARAYQVTGTTRFLTDAERNFATVNDRAQAVDGGLCENTGGGKGCYENSSANWTFVIAGRILYGITGMSSYKTDVDDVYAWAKKNLYIASSGGIADGKGGRASYYSYNYGYAVGAATYEGDSTVTNEAMHFLMYDFNNYDGVYNGWNILPNYGQGADDNDGGFNGITLRWAMFAYDNGYLSRLGGYLSWARANLEDAWAHRNSQELTWDHWNVQTPNIGGGSAVYSWDCSSAMVGMFNVPAPQ